MPGGWTLLDLAVVALAALFGLRGWARGFAWQVVRLVALAAALWGASAADGWLAARLRELLPTLAPLSAAFVAWGAVFVVLLCVGAAVAQRARDAAADASLGTVDRVGGLVLGCVTGLLVVTLLLVVGGALLSAFGHGEALDEHVRTSALAGPMRRAALLLGPWLPDGVREVWADGPAAS